MRHFALSGSEINGKGHGHDPDRRGGAGRRVEIWEIDNTTYAHNFHIHEVAFRILDVDGAAAARLPDRAARTPCSCRRRRSVRLACSSARYTDPVSPYMYHCHILRHEDKGMMGQFVIVEPGTEAGTPRSIPAPSGGHSGHPS